MSTKFLLSAISVFSAAQFTEKENAPKSFNADELGFTFDRIEGNSIGLIDTSCD
jgi:hypothetical protein